MFSAVWRPKNVSSYFTVVQIIFFISFGIMQGTIKKLLARYTQNE